MSTSMALRSRSVANEDEENMSALRDEIVALRAEVREVIAGQNSVSELIKSLREECNALTVACAQER